MYYLQRFLKAIGNMLKFSLFMLLVFLRPIVTMIFGLFSGLSLFGFLFCLLFKREEQQVMWTVFATGIGATLILWFYDALLTWVAPDDQIIMTQR